MVVGAWGLLFGGCGINEMNSSAESVKRELKSKGVEVEHGEGKKVYTF